MSDQEMITLECLDCETEFEVPADDQDAIDLGLCPECRALYPDEEDLPDRGHDREEDE